MELAQAAWFLQPCSRAPVFLIVVVGSWIAVMATFNGYGRALAKSRLNESTAQVASLAPAPVDPSENAAMIWRKAQQMLIRFEEPKGFFPSLLRTWESPEAFVEGSPILEFLNSNSEAIELAHKAAQKPLCNWGVDYSVDGNLSNTSHIAPLHALARLIDAQAIVSAHNNQWEQTITCLETSSALYDSIAADRHEIFLLISLTRYLSDVRVVERCLSAPGAKLGDAALNKLSQFFTSRLRRLTGLNYSDFFDAQRKMVHAQMDKAAAGDSRGLGPSDIPCFIDILCAFYSMNRNALGTEIDLYRDTLANILSGTEAKMPREERYSHSWGPFGSASRIAIGTYIHSLSGLDRRIKNSKAGLHSILAGLATLRYRIRHGGEWPKKLQECELDEHLSIDPWLATKAHLEFRVDDNETLVVWSVGENQKDDGGTLNDRSEKDLVLQILTDRNGGKNGKE